MGTRSVTKFVENGCIIAVMWKRYDGYLSHYGIKLVELLKSIKSKDMSLIAAKVVGYFQQRVSHANDIGLVPPNSFSFDGEYEYTINLENNEIYITIEQDPSFGILYYGSVKNVNIQEVDRKLKTMEQRYYEQKSRERVEK